MLSSSDEEPSSSSEEELLSGEEEEGFEIFLDDGMNLVRKSLMNLFSEHFCYADFLPLKVVRDRIQKFLKILTEKTGEILTDETEAFYDRLSKVTKIILCKVLSGEDIVPRLPTQMEPDQSSSQLQINRAIQDILVFVRCSPYSLGILEYGRGVIAGTIELRFQEDVHCLPVFDFARCIFMDLKSIKSLVMSTDAKYIFVLERPCSYLKSALDSVTQKNIIITATGYPDVATRFLLHRLSQAFPHLPIFALVDWSPAGLAKLYTYRFGSIDAIRNCPKCFTSVCNVKWLGVRSHDLQWIPDQNLSPLKPLDHQIYCSLLSSGILQEDKYKGELKVTIKNYRKELEIMMERGKRAQIDMYGDIGDGRNLVDYIRDKIEQADFI